MYDTLENTIATLTGPGQMFEIKQIDTDTGPLKVWANAPGNLRDLWMMAAAHGDKDYLIYQDERMTYTQAHDYTARLASWMRGQGVGQHDRVAIAMRNYPEWMLSFWAVLQLGAVPVGVNAWWVADELKYGLEDSETRLFICDKERLARFAEVRDTFPGMPVLAVRCDDLPSWATAASDAIKTDIDLPEITVDPLDDASIFYTSGTTGLPKGAQLSHRGCANNVLSTLFSTMSQLTAEAATTGGEAPNPLDPNAPQAGSLLATPLFHVTANNCVAQVMTALGGKLAHLYKWDPAEALRLIEEEQLTAFSGVPVMMREMIAHPDFATRDTSSLTTLGGGGAPVQPDLVEKVGAASQRPAQGYGLTETSGMAASSVGIYLEKKPTSAGRILPISDARSVDADGNPLPSGEVGELCIRSPQLIKGYLNRPDATAETIVDGWLHTGDIGFVDEDHFIHIVDRAKDMVLRGGENVYCTEVEVALFKHPAVAECAVFSVPDERLGEEVGAAIYPAEGQSVTAEALREFCKEKLAAFKIPRYIWVLGEPLPRNASGKFLKRELQEALDVSTAA